MVGLTCAGFIFQFYSSRAPTMTFRCASESIRVNQQSPKFWASGFTHLRLSGETLLDPPPPKLTRKVTLLGCFPPVFQDPEVGPMRRLIK